MRTVFVALGALMLASCSGGGDDLAETQAENVATVEALYASFAAGDVPAFVGILSEDIVWNEAENFPYADGNPYIGPDAVLEGVIGPVVAEWDYWNVVVEDIMPSGDDRVIATGRYEARNTANGAEISAQVAHFFTVEDGRITEFQQYADTYQVRMAVGAEAEAEEPEALMSDDPTE